MKYLRDYTEAAQTDLFKETGSFFAFGLNQFNEKKKAGVKYVNMGAGLICPELNCKKLIDGLNDIQTKGIQTDVKENGADAIIKREYFNFESQITCDCSDALNTLKQYQNIYPNQFTTEIIDTTFKKCFQLAINNDWF